MPGTYSHGGSSPTMILRVTFPYHLLCLTFYADARAEDSSGSIVRTSFSPCRTMVSGTCICNCSSVKSRCQGIDACNRLAAIAVDNIAGAQSSPLGRAVWLQSDNQHTAGDW